MRFELRYTERKSGDKMVERGDDMEELLKRGRELTTRGQASLGTVVIDLESSDTDT